MKVYVYLLGIAGCKCQPWVSSGLFPVVHFSFRLENFTIEAHSTWFHAI